MSPRLRTAVTAAVAALALGAGLTAPGDAAAAATAGEGIVELLECNRGKRAADRHALFRGEMGQVAGGVAMRMRFDLHERVGRGGWAPVAAPGLGVWHHAKPGVARFAYRQRIAAMQPGTAYRTEVAFQWHDAAGATIARQLARSPVCRQRGPLPNLRVGRIARRAGPTPDTVRYVVAVVNSGRAPAKKVELSLLVDGAEVDTHGIGTVKPRSRREVGFVGPPCASLITFQLDPGGTVREIDEGDNVRSFPCAPRL